MLQARPSSAAPALLMASFTLFTRNRGKIMPRITG
jgi:hypothetical protein